MTKDKITELGVGDATVESIISRLVRYQDDIKHITAIITFSNDSVCMCGDTKSTPDYAYDSAVLQDEIRKMLNTPTEEDDE